MLRPHPQYPHINVGRKGPLVYYARGEELCVRSYTKPRDPKSPLQRVQRSLHACLTRISGQTKGFRDFCYQGLNAYRSSHTAFIGLQMCQINRKRKSSEGPLESQLRWGRGSLPGVLRATFVWKAQPLLSWQCDKRKLSRQTDPDNRVLWIVWNATREGWRWSLQDGKRRDEACRLDLPQEWKGEELYLWVLFYDSHKRRFSSDTCLHVKAGEIEASCHIDSPTLFTDNGFLFEKLVDLWSSFHTLWGLERREFQEKWFT